MLSGTTKIEALAGTCNMTKLTRTQEKALDFIRTAIAQNGVAPTLREICAYMGYKAIGSAQDVVTALRRKGFLAETDRQSARAFVLTPLARQHQGGQDEVLDDGADSSEANDSGSFTVPLLGKVPAGNPALAVEERIGSLRVSMSLVVKSSRSTLRSGDLFALQATGDSMIGAGILDGDFLVVKLNKEPLKGSIVVARVEGDVTVKRLMFDQEAGWFLQPENRAFSNIYATNEQFEIVGEVVALQRSLL